MLQSTPLAPSSGSSKSKVPHCTVSSLSDTLPPNSLLIKQTAPDGDTHYGFQGTMVFVWADGQLLCHWAWWLLDVYLSSINDAVSRGIVFSETPWHQLVHMLSCWPQGSMLCMTLSIVTPEIRMPSLVLMALDRRSLHITNCQRCQGLHFWPWIW
jgi:hypothetical protein